MGLWWYVIRKDCFLQGLLAAGETSSGKEVGYVLATELIDGVELDPDDPSHAEMLPQAQQALQAPHNAGLVHMDSREGSILVNTETGKASHLGRH